MVTKYMVVEKKPNNKGKLKDFVIIETYQMAEVVKKLAELLEESNDT